MLYLIGLGLDKKDLSLKSREIIKKSQIVYLENYTSFLPCPEEELEKLIGKKVIPADRKLVEEGSEKIVNQAKEKNVAFLVPGNPLTATTHISLFLEAKEKNVPVEVVFNASILDALTITGLQIYNFGKIASIPFQESESPYQVLVINQKNNLHTLFLLDLNPGEGKFMTIPQAIEYLLKTEKRKKKRVFSLNSLVLACARLGQKEYFIKWGKAKDLLGIDFGQPPYCLIVPARKLHFKEEEALRLYA